MLNLDTSFLYNTLGITCLENFLTAWIRYDNLPYQSLYYKSFIPVNTTICDFIRDKQTYLQYEGIERLHRVSRSLKLYQCIQYDASFDEMMGWLSDKLSINLPLMVQIDADKIKNGNTTVSPWRYDHLLLAYKIEDDVISFLDDYPQRSIQYTVNDLKDIFIGSVIQIKPIRLFEINEYLEACSQALLHMEVSRCPLFNEYGFSRIIYIRDAIGILRISRNRIFEWYKWMLINEYIKPDSELANLLDSQIKAMNKLYSSIEYIRLRKTDGSNLIKTSLNHLDELDMKISYKLKKVMCL